VNGPGNNAGSHSAIDGVSRTAQRPEPNGHFSRTFSASVSAYETDTLLELSQADSCIGFKKRKRQSTILQFGETRLIRPSGTVGRTGHELLPQTKLAPVWQ